MATRRFKVTLKDSPSAPASYTRGPLKFKRGESFEITNVSDADYFDAQDEFQVQELFGAAAEKSAEKKKALPKGRFSKSAPAPESEESDEEEQPEDADAEYVAEAPAESSEEEPADELAEALKPKAAKGKGKSKKAAE
jgi:hypothetical protein